MSNPRYFGKLTANRRQLIVGALPLAIAKRLGRHTLAVQASRLPLRASLRRTTVLVTGVAVAAVQLTVAVELR